MAQRLWDSRLAEVWAWPGRAGSGVAIGARGVLTAHHVVAQASREPRPGGVLVRLIRRGEPAPRWVNARVLAADSAWDLAILEVEPDADDAPGWAAPPSAEPGWWPWEAR
ncbi:S1 family peptidase [Phytohabitans rumicis]|uniref:Serine protease n=1 Tax=Phytohabitans rumicis TaxID=1076125 RepID=A0A6V8LE93_9ACTN|nr:serine protease [Phytohabitans rumicis]GFJ95562.1 hypothetical protein Prum_092040 [Phytohabitans rumicis]